MFGVLAWLVGFEGLVDWLGLGFFPLDFRNNLL